jgi:uncharacterized protein (TIGR03083 family)
MDQAAFYQSSRSRFADLVRDLPDEELDCPVPATPGLSVRDVVAHLAGLLADVVAGRTEGLGTDEATARQVAERRGRPLADVLSEWESTPLPDEVASWLPADVVIHEQDVRGALGRPGATDTPEFDAMLNGLAWWTGSKLEKSGLPALRIVAGPQEWTLGQGEVGATLTASPEVVGRVLSGRRSAAQVRTLPWDGDCSPYLDHISVFGPLPEADVIER